MLQSGYATLWTAMKTGWFRLVPVFRRCFQVKPGLAEATLRIMAHGVYKAELNGKPVTDHKFTPGLTSYYHRIQVQAYDVKTCGRLPWVTAGGAGTTILVTGWRCGVS